MKQILKRIETLLVNLSDQQAMPDDTWLKEWLAIQTSLATEPVTFWAVMTPGDWDCGPAPLNYWTTEDAANAQLARLQAKYPRAYAEHYVEEQVFNSSWEAD